MLLGAEGWTGLKLKSDSGTRGRERTRTIIVRLRNRQEQVELERASHRSCIPRTGGRLQLPEQVVRSQEGQVERGHTTNSKCSTPP